MHNKIVLAVLILAGTGAYHSTRAATVSTTEDETEGQLQEITVTAQRREENQQRVPIEIHAVDASTALAMGIDDTQDLGKLVPGLTYMRNTTNGLVFLRGVGAPTGAPGTESPIATYMDGVYIASMSGNMLSLGGIQRVEVDNGPQGTLFGRNALGGAIQIITKDPQSHPSFDGYVGYGNYGTTDVSLYGTTPVTDTVAVSAAFDDTHQQDGWGTNLYNGDPSYRPENLDARVKVLWTPDDKTRVSAWFYFDRLTDSAGAATSFLHGSVGGDGISTAQPNFYNVDENLQSEYTNWEYVGSVKGEHEFSWARLISISGYNYLRSIDLIDLDAVPISISEQNPNRLYSEAYTQELQLASLPSSPITWIGGLFYYYNVSGVDPARVLGTGVHSVCGPTCTYYDINTRPLTHSAAGYAQATAPITQRLRFTGGVRFTRDIRHVVGEYDASTGVAYGAGDQEKGWSNVSYRGAFDFDITESILAYASFSTGFNSGYFNGGAPAQPAVNPAKIGDAEVGIKSEFLDRRARVNVSGFHYDYDNIVLKQVQSFGTILLLNAAKAELYGADVSFDFVPTNRLTFHGAFETLHSEFTSFPGAPLTVQLPNGRNQTIVGNLTGQQLFIAPAFTGSVGAEYSMPSTIGTFLLASSYQYNGGFNWNGTANADGTPNGRIREHSYDLLNTSLMWTSLDGRWSLRGWGKNITSTKYHAFVQTNANGDTYSPGPPATYGITFGMHF
jgi:iron complex outermembrane receptor protein